MSGYKPPFHFTEKITNLLSEISEKIGMINVIHRESYLTVMFWFILCI